MKETNRSGQNFAEFETIIERILSADNAAKEQAKKAEQERQEAIQHIDVQKSELRSKYSERAARRIEIVSEQEEAFSKETIEQNLARQQKRLEALNALAQQNMDAWVDRLFNSVIQD